VGLKINLSPLLFIVVPLCDFALVTHGCLVFQIVSGLLGPGSGSVSAA
jgi:hypothetical protein